MEKIFTTPEPGKGILCGIYKEYLHFIIEGQTTQFKNQPLNISQKKTYKYQRDNILKVLNINHQGDAI